MKRKIGLIGLGNIGGFYAGRLLEDGFPLTVYDIDASKQEKVVQAGAKGANSPSEATAGADVVILSLPNSEIVENVMTGDDSILSTMRPGSLLMDTSTCRPRTAILMEKLCAKKGVGFVDCPLSWRKPGQLMMVGGSPENFASAEEILICLSYRYQLVGPVGSGQNLKMINQAVMANVLAAHAEAVELTKQLGLDPKLLRDFLEFDVHDALFTEEYKGGSNLAIHYKDLGYLNEIAHDVCANIPISALVHELFKTTRLYGEPDWIQAGIQTYYQRLNEKK